MSETLNADTVTRSLTGFDEIAIEKYFRAPIPKLAENGTTMMRALLFVLAKRDGASCQEAYQRVMEMPMGDVVGRFYDGKDAAEVDDPGEA